jgi:hypothetical protein
MSEPRLYRAYTHPQMPWVHVDEGTPITVNGTPMVEWGPTFVRADGWHATRAAALNAAALELEQHAAEVTGRAAQLRKEAADAVE